MMRKMYKHLRILFICLCLFSQQLICHSAVPAGYTSAAAKQRRQEARAVAANERLNVWNDIRMLEYNGKIERLQYRLRRSVAYGDIMNFLENSSCGKLKAPLTWLELPGGVIYTTLGYFALLIGEGCPQLALTAAHTMVSALSKHVSPDQVPQVPNGFNCSKQGDVQIKNIMFEESELVEVYTLISGGVYGSLGCNELLVSTLPALVRYSYDIANVPKKSEPLVQLDSDEDKLYYALNQLNTLKKELDNRNLRALPDRIRRQSGCEKGWEKTIRRVVRWIPIVGSVYSLGSAIGYAIADCPDVAKSRGLSAITTIAGEAFSYIFG